MPGHNAQLAVFFDYDNQKVDPAAVLDYLKELGRVAIKRAYGDWVRDRGIRGAMSEQDVELIDRPRFGLSDRQGNDILLAADAVEVALTRSNIDTVVLVTGDSDFLPLISRLKGHGKTVMLVSSEKNSSPRLRAACDRFISFEAIAKAEELAPEDARERAFALFRRVERMFRDRGEPLTAPRCQQAMVQLDPGFEPRAAGFPDFPAFFAEAERGDDEEPRRLAPAAADEENRWQWLISSLYAALDRVREAGVPATPEAVERALTDMVAQFTPRAFGKARFGDLARELARRDSVEIVNGLLVMPRRVAWERYLRNAVLRPNPGLRAAFIRELLALAHTWDPPETRTLKALAARLWEDRRIAGLARKSLNELMRAVKFSGLVQPQGEQGYVTFLMPCEIHGDAADLERGMGKAYLKGMLKARPGRDEDFTVMADMVFGDPKAVANVRTLMEDLVSEGELRREGTEYYYAGITGPSSAGPAAADA